MGKGGAIFRHNEHRGSSARQGIFQPPGALEISPFITEALALVERGLAPPLFDPATAQGSIGIAGSDYVLTAVIPSFVAALHASAPGINIHIFPVNRFDMITKVDHGEVDLAIGWFESVPERFDRCLVIEESEILVVARGHELTAGKITAERLLAVPHIVVDYTGTDEVEDMGVLTERGLARRVRMERGLQELSERENLLEPRIGIVAPSFHLVPQLVVQTGMVATLPRRFAERAAQHYDLVLLEPPYEYPVIPVEAIWNKGATRGAVHKWMLDVLKRSVIAT